ncbi:putative reverse transcriptase domain-containing protein [Tanacetum coccineum]|uniref:Reverse transcriptase domain-containing protein n=1 Tax=Tanacetum coccineum TaxID=301880 RepID=A0ABQ5H2A2_9ASTR
MSVTRQGMSSVEIDQIVAQRVTDAIEAIAIYETKTRMTHDLMNQVMQQETTVEKNANNKRKFENQPKDNRVPQQPPFKKPDVTTAYTIGANEKKAYGRKLPYCNKWEMRSTRNTLGLSRNLLKNKEFYAKFYESEFWLPKVQFFVHVADNQGIHGDFSKIEFIEGFSKIAKPMTKLTQNNVKFDWGEKEEAAYQLLKQKTGRGFDGEGESHSLRITPTQGLNYTTYDLELGAVLFALKMWRHYMYDTKCVMFTDHKSLQHILDQKELNMRQRRWLEFLSDYDYVPRPEEVVLVVHQESRNSHLCQQALDAHEDEGRLPKTIRFTNTTRNTPLEMGKYSHGLYHKPAKDNKLLLHDLGNRDHQKNYADVGRKPLEFHVGVEYGVSTSIGYDVSSFLSSTSYSFQQINTAYPLPLDTAYRSSGTKAEIFDFRAKFFTFLRDKSY